MESVYRSVFVFPSEHCITADQLFNNTTEGINRVLHHCLQNGENVKVYPSTSVTMQKVNVADGRVDEEKTFYFNTTAAPIQTVSDMANHVDSIRYKVDK